MVSFPKSGRTWISHLYVYYGVYVLLAGEADGFLDTEFSGKAFLSKPHRSPAFTSLLASRDRPKRVPRVDFVHRYTAQPYWDLRVPVERVEGRSVVFLVRDPRDVVVSYYHHIRGEPRERLARDVDLKEFIRSDSMGVRAVLAYMNQVAARAPALSRQPPVLYYEDVVSDTQSALTALLRSFSAHEVDADAIARAVERASFARLQQRELAGKTPDDIDRLRFRRGRPGSHNDELDPDDIAYLDRVVAAHIHPTLDRYRTPARITG